MIPKTQTQMYPIPCRFCFSRQRKKKWKWKLKLKMKTGPSAGGGLFRDDQAGRGAHVLLGAVGRAAGVEKIMSGMDDDDDDDDDVLKFVRSFVRLLVCLLACLFVFLFVLHLVVWPTTHKKVFPYRKETQFVTLLYLVRYSVYKLRSSRYIRCSIFYI